MNSTNQASSHSYLGQFSYCFNEFTYFSDFEKVQLPIILLQNIVLFPNDVLPMRIQKQNNLPMFESMCARTENLVLGIVSMLSTSNASANLINELTFEPPSSLLRPNLGLARFGVTIEIPSYKIIEDEIIFVAKVRQRFEITQLYLTNKVIFCEAIVQCDKEPQIGCNCESSIGFKYSSCGNMREYSGSVNPYHYMVILKLIYIFQ